MKTLSRISTFIGAAALVIGLGAATASADEPQSASGASARTTQQNQGQPKVKQLIFGEGSDVEGGVVGPNGDTVNVAGPIVHSNLIRVRQDFIPEIFKSAENL